MNNIRKKKERNVGVNGKMNISCGNKRARWSGSLMTTMLVSMVHKGVPGRERDAKFEKDIITGLISLILLAITANSRKPMYGYQIAQQMKGGKSSTIELKQGTIYPVLRTMEKKGLLKSEIKASSSGPARKYYKITGPGKKKLVIWMDTWKRTKMFVDGVLGGSIND